jgi:DUF4097 and DUF4098 domain-containing protein YvlB
MNTTNGGLSQMKGKSVIAGILIVALIAVCGLSILAAWQGVRMAQSSGVHFNIGSVNTVEAKDTEEKTLSVSSTVDLKVENDFGFITVQRGADGEVLVKADKTAWGSSDADAQQALEDLQVIIEQDGDKIRVHLQRPNEIDIINIGPVRGAQANFTITVPVFTDVDLKSANGELTLTGIQGTAALNTSFGDIDVKNLAGGLFATTSNGGISVENVDTLDASFELSSDFGDVTVRSIDARDVTIKSTNGRLNLNGINSSGKLDLRTYFGGIEIRESEARSLDAHTSNGNVLAENINVSGTATISSDFGDLTLINVLSNHMDLKTQNGRITVNGGRGTIKAQSGFGDVEVSAEEAIVTLISDNGKVSFSGTLQDGEHLLQSDFGNIQLMLPADIALNFDLKTDFGKIKSDFPVTISGDLDEKHWIGVINGGGAQLTVSTQNGNITIQSSE